MASCGLILQVNKINLEKKEHLCQISLKSDIDGFDWKKTPENSTTIKVVLIKEQL